MTEFVGRQHEFHDQAYVEDWSARFAPTPDRTKLFDTIIDRLCELSLPSRHIVELGMGPAYLAERLLAKDSTITYEGVDFSSLMLSIAQRRLASHANRVR